VIRGLVIREARAEDAAAIRSLLDAAFGGDGEGRLVERLRAEGDVVLELVATHEGELVGELLFSRLRVAGDDGAFDAVALAPLAVIPGSQRTGIGRALVEHAHPVLQARGERLSIVLGEPEYYARFGYSRDRATGFDSDYQGDYLQALAWGEAPASGRLVYAPAFAAL